MYSSPSERESRIAATLTALWNYGFSRSSQHAGLQELKPLSMPLGTAARYYEASQRRGRDITPGAGASAMRPILGKRRRAVTASIFVYQAGGLKSCSTGAMRPWEDAPAKPINPAGVEHCLKPYVLLPLCSSVHDCELCIMQCVIALALRLRRIVNCALCIVH